MDIEKNKVLETSSNCSEAARNFPNFEQKLERVFWIGFFSTNYAINCHLDIKYMAKNCFNFRSFFTYFPFFLMAPIAMLAVKKAKYFSPCIVKCVVFFV